MKDEKKKVSDKPADSKPAVAPNKGGDSKPAGGSGDPKEDKLREQERQHAPDEANARKLTVIGH